MANEEPKNPYENAEPIRTAHKSHPEASAQDVFQNPASGYGSQSLRTPSSTPSGGYGSGPDGQRATYAWDEADRRPSQDHVMPPNPVRVIDQNSAIHPQIVMHTRRKMGFGILAGLIIFCILVLVWLLWFINRPVPVTVNGESAETRIGSKLTDVLHEQHVSVQAGDYVAVDDSVLKTGAGYAYTAVVNGTELTPQQAKDYRIEGSEAIEFSNGKNITEEFTSTEETLMPYLRMDGNGYSFQYVSQWGYTGTLEHRVGNDSGIAADVVTKAPQDCIICCRDFFFQDGNYVALTFDDGPLSPYTDQILDILASHNAKATFFTLGDSIAADNALAQRVVAEGHQIANHTMAHNQLTAVEPQEIYDQILKSAQVIEAASGVHTTYLRPPYGDFTERSWLATNGIVSASIRWTADSHDWSLPGADAIISNSLLNLHSGTVILMHDGGGDRSQDVLALTGLIETLQAQGYQFVTVSEMLRLAGDVPEDICTGTAMMPEGAVWPTEIHPDDLAAAGITPTTDQAPTP